MWLISQTLHSGSKFMTRIQFNSILFYFQFYFIAPTHNAIIWRDLTSQNYKEKLRTRFRVSLLFVRFFKPGLSKPQMPLLVISSSSCWDSKDFIKIFIVVKVRSIIPPTARPRWSISNLCPQTAKSIKGGASPDNDLCFEMWLPNFEQSLSCWTGYRSH